MATKGCDRSARRSLRRRLAVLVIGASLALVAGCGGASTSSTEDTPSVVEVFCQERSAILAQYQGTEELSSASGDVTPEFVAKSVEEWTAHVELAKRLLDGNTALDPRVTQQIDQYREAYSDAIIKAGFEGVEIYESPESLQALAEVLNQSFYMRDFCAAALAGTLEQYFAENADPSAPSDPADLASARELQGFAARALEKKCSDPKPEDEGGIPHETVNCVGGYTFNWFGNSADVNKFADYICTVLDEEKADPATYFAVISDRWLSMVDDQVAGREMAGAMAGEIDSFANLCR